MGHKPTIYLLDKRESLVRERKEVERRLQSDTELQIILDRYRSFIDFPVSTSYAEFVAYAGFNPVDVCVAYKLEDGSTTITDLIKDTSQLGKAQNLIYLILHNPEPANKPGPHTMPQLEREGIQVEELRRAVADASTSHPINNTIICSIKDFSQVIELAVYMAPHTPAMLQLLKEGYHREVRTQEQFRNLRATASRYWSN